MAGKKSEKPDYTPLVLVFMAFTETVGVATIVIQIYTRVIFLGANTLRAGLIVAIYGGVQLFSSPYVGRMADRGHKKRLLITSLLLSATSYMLLSTDAIMLFCVSRFLSGIVKHTHLLMMGIITDIVPPQIKGAYYGYFGAAIGMGFIFGPIIGGHFAEYHDGFTWMCYFGAAIFFTNAVIAYQFLPNSTNALKKPDKEHKKTSKKLTGFAGALHNLGIESCWDILLLQGLCELAMMTHFTNFGAIFTSEYELPPSYIGYCIAMLSVIGTISSLFAGKLENVFGHQTLPYVILSILVCYVVLVVPNISLNHYLLALCASSVGVSLLRVWWPNMAMSKSDPEKSSSIVGAVHSVMAIAGMFGPFMAGATTHWFSTAHGATYVATFLLATACLISQVIRLPAPQFKVTKLQ